MLQAVETPFNPDRQGNRKFESNEERLRLIAWLLSGARGSLSITFFPASERAAAGARRGPENCWKTVKPPVASQGLQDKAYSSVLR